MLYILFALACVPASGDIDIDPNQNPGGGDDTGDTGEEQPEPHFAAGDYDGEVGWWIPDAWDGWVICELDAELTVDDEGNFELDDICIYYGDSGNYDLIVEISGVFDEDGEITGTIFLETWAHDGDWYLEEVEAELDGETDGEDIEFSFWAEIPLYGYDYELEGWGDLSQ